jgi:hypothetical protein
VLVPANAPLPIAIHAAHLHDAWSATVPATLILGRSMHFLSPIFALALLSAPALAQGADLVAVDEIGDLTSGGWQLAAEWDGYMGVSVAFYKDNTFSYWFYSDVVSTDVPRPNCPIKGTWKLDGASVILEASDHLYSNKYHYMSYGGFFCLVPDGDLLKIRINKPVDLSRLHFNNANFKESDPFGGRKSYKSIE